MIMYNITKNRITEFWDLRNIYQYAEPEEIVIVFENMRLFEIWKSAYDSILKITLEQNGSKTLEEIHA